MEHSAEQITRMLNEVGRGSKASLDKLLPIIYDELRRISSRYLRDEYREHTLQTTELVHEAYIKLLGSRDISWQNRGHFFGIAARTMREILVDYARQRNARKRGSGESPLSLDEARYVPAESDDQLLALDEALRRLESVDQRSSRIVELRYFSGLRIEEVAEALDISVATVKRDWGFAKAWLYREMQSVR